MNALYKMEYFLKRIQSSEQELKDALEKFEAFEINGNNKNEPI